MKIFADMNILLVSATTMEVAHFRDLYARNKQSDFKGIDIRFLTSGIGMLSTAARLTGALKRDPVDLIIQAGICGSFDNNFQPGTVYWVETDAIADMGVMEDNLWKDVFDLGLVGSDEPPYTGRSLFCRKPLSLDLADIPSANAITVNEVTTDPARIVLYRQRFNADLESMEGAALHFVALENNIPFLQLRSVSNYIGDRNKANWKIKESVFNLNETLAGLIKNIQI